MIRRIAIFLVNFFMKVFYRHKVYGKKNVPPVGGIVASNHCSFLDPPIIGISCPYEVHFLARETLFRFKPFGWLIRQLNTHPVVKGRENVATIKKACDFLEHGKKVAIFPEGRRSSDGEFQKGQAGVGMLVLRTHTFVIPVYIHGTFDIWSVHRKFPRLKGKTACVFGTPLDFSHLKNLHKKEAQLTISETIMEAIKSLKEWYEKGAEGTPP